jgi:tetratricopeptide (TPR) repeat protein
VLRSLLRSTKSISSEEPMLRRRCICLLLLSLSVAFADTKASPTSSGKAGFSTTLPVTTSSKPARENFERAMRRFEQYRIDETLQCLREAVKTDPKFAQALMMIAKISKDPAEQRAARQRAQHLAPTVTAGEQLLIRWLGGAQEDDYLPAIAAMNDLLASYPDDHRLAFLAGDWLMLQERYEQAEVVLQHALTLLPDYPAALNDLAYAYANKLLPSWSAIWPLNPTSPTRTIPMAKFYAWPASSTRPWSNTGKVSTLIQISAPKSASLIPMH